MTCPAVAKTYSGLAPGDVILIAEDHPLVLHSIKTQIAAAFPQAKILQASNEAEVIRQSCNSRIRLAMLDVFLDGIKSFESLRQLKLRQPDVLTIFFTGHVSSEVVTFGQDLGVEGYISKATDIDTLVQLMHLVVDGTTIYCPRFQKVADLHKNVREEIGVLTRREKEIYEYTLLGMTVQEVAKAANISFTTVKKHRQNILRKLNFSSSAKLLAYTKIIKMDEGS